MTYALEVPVDDPYRVAPQVPLIVLPGPGYRILPWRRPSGTAPAATDALCALDRLIAAARSADRRDLSGSLPDAVTALGRLAEAMAPEGAALLGEEVEPGKLIHRYFGARHSDAMLPATMGFHAVLVARWCTAELEYAALDANDILAELAAWRTVVAGLAETPLPTHTPTKSSRPDARTRLLLEYLPDGDPWDRWIVAHHGYLLLNLLAAGSIEAAADCVIGMLPGRAVEHLRTAAVQARGMTALMIHSAVLPGRLYLDEIRPSMAPPALPKPLTGNAFHEHHQYHRAIARLLDLGDRPFPDLRLCAPDLAAARDDLLDADLADIERHITMGETLIRDDRSLVQQTGEKDSAVAELRRMRARRIERYRPYMRFGAEQA